MIFLFCFLKEKEILMCKNCGGGTEINLHGIPKILRGQEPSLRGQIPLSAPLKCTFNVHMFCPYLFFKGYITIQAWVLMVLADICICSLLLVSYCPQLLLLQDIITSLHKSSSVVMCRYLYNFNEDVGERLSQDWTSLLKLLGPVLELAKYQQGITLGWWVGLVWSCDVQRDQ